MVYGSVCSGIEAATMAWHSLGWTPAFFSEIEAFPSAVLAHHYGSNMPGEPLAKNGIPNYGDFTQIGPDAGPVDLLVGGTPCQSFSVAGKRLGLDDPRGNLALEYLALARRLRARWIVWENVPGVLSSHTDDEQDEEEKVEGDEGLESADFATFLSFVQECGYGFAYRVLDAQYIRVDDYARAVPQRRRRVFLVGYLGDWRRAAAVLLEPESMRGDSAPRREARQDLAGNVAYGISPDCLDRDGEGSGGTVAERSGLGLDPDVAYALRARRAGGVAHAFGGNRSTGPVDVATAVNAHGGPHGRLDFESETFVAEVARTLTRGAESSGKGGYAGRRQEDDDNIVAFAIQAGALRENPASGPDGVGVQADVAYTLEARSEVQAAQLGWAVRRPMPIECERLQGFPDNFTDVPWRGKNHAPDGPRYKALGNSMAVNAMRWIGQRIDIIEKLIKSGRIAA
ncbi:hypothetical protein CDO26_10750 [Sinorhizobium meliloti]|nr:DNA cytosine methyltransferase [Sinorhizobium meliloti]ASP86456.1 hypothetical protein CDO26_10750 [Sinorhizobium meliloti]MQW28471.1 DNA (cytosine-5-)-methyltransferase [Sinorhizobium meliloti]